MSDNDFAKGAEADLDPAIEHFRQKTAMTREQIDALSAEMRRRVFFITGLADLELIKRVQLSLAKSMENGETFKDWKKRIRQELTDPKFTEKRLRTIFRTNVQNIFATGRYAALTSDAARKRKPYWKFSAIRDGRTTRVCKQSHGVILHMDHPWWKNHIPPLHFNCRSTIVPLSEKEARAAGITQFPSNELPPLGFGHLPDPIVTEPGVVPSEEERQKREQLADEAREAEEKAAAAAQKATEARKNLRKAKKHNIAQLPAAEKALRAAEKQAAIEEKKARAKGENVPRNWQPTEAGLIRRFGKKLAASLIAAWRSLKGLWHKIPSSALMRNEDGYVRLPPFPPPKKITASKKQNLPKVNIRELAPDELPELGLGAGLLPDLSKEAKLICAPVGRHCTPLTIKDRAKPLNTLYPPSKKKTVQDETNAIKRGEGSVVEIITRRTDGTEDIRFGYKMASGNIYGIKPHQNKRQWRLYPVEGPDFVVLNMEEYKALKGLFSKDISRGKFLLTDDNLIDTSKVIDLFDKTMEYLK